MYELLPLISSKLELEALVSLCQASKQLHDQCLDLSDQQLRSIVQQSLKQKKRKIFINSQHTLSFWDADSCCSSLAWLLGALSKRWGIMQLAARLDLQQALLAAGRDSYACHILIAAGARMSRDLLRACPGPVNEGPRAWAYAYSELGLSRDVHKIFIKALKGDVSYVRYFLHKARPDSQLRFDLAALTLKTDALSMERMFLYPPVLLPLQLGWSPKEVLDLALLAAKRLEVYATIPSQQSYSCKHYGDVRPVSYLIGLPAAQGISGRGYADLLLVLLKCLWTPPLKKIVELVVPRVEWDQQLIKQIGVALSSLPRSRRQADHTEKCTACSFLASRKCSAAIGHLPSQLLTGLFKAVAATRLHEETATLLINLMASSPSITTPAEALSAVAVVLKQWQETWAGTYGCSFKLLLQYNSVQQLQRADLLQLVQQAVAQGCAEGVECLLRGIPAAKKLEVPDLQQLLVAAMEQQLPVLAAVVKRKLSAKKLLGVQELQLLLLECFYQDDCEALRLLMQLPVAKRVPLAAACELMLHAVSAGAINCLQELLQLVRQLGDVPLAVLQQVLPVLMSRSCESSLLTPASIGKIRCMDSNSSSSCAVCSLLKAAAGKLAAADLWEVLVAAAMAPVLELHLEGLACLPGVDELGDEQVEQLLMAAIEAMELEDGEPEQQLLRKLEQLQGELLYNKQLPTAAVHRLMVACVGKAVEGGVGRLREELGLQGERWEGGLSQEQLKQLLGVAVKCVTNLPRAGWKKAKRAKECRSCLLMLAKLPPTVREKQQMAEGLKAAHMEVAQGKGRFGGSSDSDSYCM